MNVIRKQKGTYILYQPGGEEICSLGPEITAFVRRVVLHARDDFYVSDVVKYVVEIKESLIHTVSDCASENNRAVISIPVESTDCQIAMNVLKADGMGAPHRFGTQEIRACMTEKCDCRKYVMTIDGLLWDGQILHVKDIAA